MENQKFIQAALQSRFYQQNLKWVSFRDWREIPLTTKQDLRRAEPYDLLGTSFENIATYHETIGTTGTPTPSWFSFQDAEREADVVLNSAIKFKKSDLVLNRFPFAMALPSFIVYWACQKVKCGHIGVDKASLVTPYARVVELMRRANPSILTILPSEAMVIAGAAKRMGVSLPTKGLRALLVGGELVSPNRKKQLEKVWGVPVYGLFGSTETGGLFMTCEKGNYHIDNPNVKVEILDEKGNALIEKKGKLVISTLREGMPLLRYANQDLAEIQSGDTCGCGNQHAVLIYYGREEDQITVNNVSLDFYTLQEIISKLPIIPMLWQCQAYSGHLNFRYQLLDSSFSIPSSRIEKELEAKLSVPVQAYQAELVQEDMLKSKPAYEMFSYIQKPAEVIPK